jgi:hypothetical protein
MKPEDDPEARIRELERPLAETARASEVAASQTPGGYAYPPGPPVAPPTLSYGGPFSGTSARSPSRFRLLWLLAPFLVIGAVALVSYNADRHSRGGLVILSPTPSASATQTPVPQPSTSPTSGPMPPAGANLSISGINQNRTIACNGSVVSVSGISNKVVITGHCASLTVSGVQNSVTVDAVDTIEAAGFNNQVTYHTGSPSIDKSGEQNVVQQG